MSLATLVEALDGLEHDAGRRKEYNDWLQEFQRSPKAWEVVYEVLETESFSRALKIFSAQTLRNKIAFDLHQVPRGARMHLKEQVLLLLERNASLLSVVGVQLCIALAALAMQLGEWDSPIEELMTRFESTEMVPLLFEFLKVLPEEFSATRAGMVDPELRLQRSTSLVQDSAPTVLNFMMTRADVMAAEGSTQSLFFEALSSWLGEIDLPQIMESPLVDWIFSGIENEEARTPAVDCLILILRETSEVQEIHVQDAIRVLFPKLVKLSPQYTPYYEDNPELLRDFTRMYCEAGQAWHALVAREPRIFMPLLQAVAQCIATPGLDLEIADYTYDFFDKLRSVIGEAMPGAQPDDKEPMRVPFRPIFLQMLTSYTQMLQFPVSFDGNKEEEEVFRDFRYDIGDLLKICGSIVGYEQTLEWCHEQLLTLVSVAHSIRFQPLEAMLFCVRALARIVPFEENLWMPQIFDLLPKIPYTNEELVQHAVLMMVGRYSQWTSKHPEYLSFSLQYVISAVWSPLPEVRRAAAHAFLYLCTDASYEMVPFLPQMLQFYGTVSEQIPHSQIDLESFAKYSDGIGSIMNHLRGLDLLNAVNFITEPAAKRAQLLVNRVVGGAVTSNLPLSEQERQVAYDTHGLGGVVAMVGPIEDTDTLPAASHPLIIAIRENHSLYMTMLAQFGAHKVSIVESISRYYCRVLFNLATLVQEELTSLMQTTLAVVEEQPLSPTLYELGSAVVQCFNRRQPTNQTLTPRVWEFGDRISTALFSEKIVKQLETQGGIVEHVTTVSQTMHHGFHMLCDLATYYPQEFYNNLFERTVKLSADVLTLSWDTEVLVSVSHFYEDVETYLFRTEPELVDRWVTDEIFSVVSSQGYQVIHALFYLFLLKPDQFFEPKAERMVDFLFRIAPVASVTWLQHLLMSLPEGSVSDDERITFAQQIFQHASTGTSKVIGQEMNAFVKAYAARNMSVR